MHIQVKPDTGHQGTLHFLGNAYPCALGKSGVTATKREGDHASPIGVFDLRAVYYRADKLAKPACVLPCQEITAQDGWCDDPQTLEYNQRIVLPFSKSHEVLWRDDDLYDLVVILGHNDNPPVPGAGSCIFMHVAKSDFDGTEGCVALNKPDLLELLSNVSADTQIKILPLKTI